MGYHAWRQALADGVTPIWQARAFYTASTPRIPQRSRLRRGFVPRSPVTCRQESNDSRPLDLRGELLLRVVRLDRLCGVRLGVRIVGCDRADPAGAAAVLDPVRHGHSTDGDAVDSVARRRLPRVSEARQQVRSVAAEAALTRRVTDRRTLRSMPVLPRSPADCSRPLRQIEGRSCRGTLAGACSSQKATGQPISAVR